MLPDLFHVDDRRLICRIGRETLWIEPIGEGAIRVRATRNSEFEDALPSGLLPDVPVTAKGRIEIGETLATLTNGRLRAEIRKMARGLEPTLGGRQARRDGNTRLLAFRADGAAAGRQAFGRHLIAEGTQSRKAGGE